MGNSINTNKENSDLLIALTNNDKFSIEYLLNNCKDLNSPINWCGDTISHYLLKQNKISIFMNMVVTRNMNYLIENTYGNLPIDCYLQGYNITERNFELLATIMHIDYNRGNNDGVTLLHRMCNKKTFTNTIIKLYDNGEGNFNTCSKSKYYPIHFLAMQNNVEVIRHLVDKDFDFYVVTARKNNIMHYICNNNNFNLISLLHDHNIDIKRLINLYNIDNISPIMVSLKNPIIIKFFLKHSLIDFDTIKPDIYARLMKIALENVSDVTVVAPVINDLLLFS